jgi:small subunit ribosomal protein S17
MAENFECNDAKCALHGSLKTRGNVFVGKVVNLKARKTAVVERQLLHFVQKFERYEKVRSRIKAYLPDCIRLKLGDNAVVAECRKLSKTKAFVVIGKEEKK